MYEERRAMVMRSAGGDYWCRSEYRLRTDRWVAGGICITRCAFLAKGEAPAKGSAFWP